MSEERNPDDNQDLKPPVGTGEGTTEGFTQEKPSKTSSTEREVKPADGNKNKTEKPNTEKDNSKDDVTNEPQQIGHAAGYEK
jgi:hypothetical protein